MLVIGPCGAGKTTWLAAQPWPRGWFTVDLETVLDVVQAGPRSYTPAARALARVMFDAALGHAAQRGLNVAVTATGATRRERAAVLDRFPPARYCRTIVIVRPDDPELPIARAMADPLRPRSARAGWRAIVERWYRRWEPVTPDEADLIVWGTS